jgi:PAS domain S-box-containing protein
MAASKRPTPTCVEAELRDSEERLRAILDSAVDAILTIDARGIIDSANPAAQNIFGYSRREMVGKNVRMLMPQPFRGQHDGYLHRYLETGQAKIIGIGRELVGQRKDGTTFPLYLSVGEMQLGGKGMFTGIIHDITERRRLEREILEIGTAEQRRIGQELHDGLCQDLVGMALGISLLSQKLQAERPALAAEADKLAAMVRDSATQARDLSHGLAPVEVVSGGLVSALQQLATRVSELFQVECTFHNSGATAPSDVSTATNLYRIVQEAVSNAIKHGKAQRVEIRLEGDSNEMVLSIRDNGRGFPHVPGKGLGLQTMGYRSRLIGAVLTISPAPQGGTVVRCAVLYSVLHAVAANGNRAMAAASRRSAVRRGRGKGGK